MLQRLSQYTLYRELLAYIRRITMTVNREKIVAEMDFLDFQPEREDLKDWLD